MKAVSARRPAHLFSNFGGQFVLQFRGPSFGISGVPQRKSGHVFHVSISLLCQFLLGVDERPTFKRNSMSSRRTCGELLCNASLRSLYMLSGLFCVNFCVGGRAPNIQTQLNVFAPHLWRIPLQSLLGSAQALCGPCFKLVTISMNVYAAGARFKHIVCAVLAAMIVR